MAIETSENETYGIWAIYGLRGNPFSPDPLQTFGGELPMTTFFGREKEVRELNGIITNNSKSRILVSGNIGIGKTTFVNYARSKAFEKGYFTTISEIGIQHDWNAEDFMRVTLSAIYTSINRIKGAREKLDDTFLEKLDVYFGTLRGASQGLSGGIATVSIGGAKGVSYGAPEVNSFMMKDTLSEVVENLKLATYRGLIVHYNNLELLNEDERSVVKLFNGIRDFLQVDGAHFVFVGDMTVPDVLQKVPRVDDVFYGPPIHLDAFSFEEVCQVLDRRVKELSIGGNVIPESPYTKDTVALLYRLYSGNIRAIFRSLTAAITSVADSNKPVRLQPLLMARTLRKIAEERHLATLNQTEIKILNQIIIRKETTNKLVSEALKMKPQNVSNAITKLRTVNCIRLSRVEGRARYYVPAPEIKWLLLNISTDDEQTLIQDFISKPTP